MRSQAEGFGGGAAAYMQVPIHFHHLLQLMTLYDVIRCYMVLHDIIQYYMMLFNIIRCYSILYDSIRCHTILYHIIRCHTILYDVERSKIKQGLWGEQKGSVQGLRG